MLHMAQEINLGGTIYVSSKRAAEITGYTQDYIGQLARAGSITAQRVSGLWYVVEQSLREYKTKADEFKPTPPPLSSRSERQLESSISFDGKDYVSAQRAAEITGYHADYVGQLARTGKVVSRQVGNRWFVDREGVVEHKRHNDALLAAVQAESVGLMKQEPMQSIEPEVLYFSYTESSVQDSPELQVAEAVVTDESETVSEELITEIPIRVIKSTKDRYLGRNSNVQKRSFTMKMVTTLTVLVLVSIPVAGGVYYAYTSKNVSRLVGKGTISEVSQMASALIPALTEGQNLKVPDALAGILSNTLHFRRDSF